MASTAALAGSVVDSKSLTDSASGRAATVQMFSRERDLSPGVHPIRVVDLTKDSFLGLFFPQFFKTSALDVVASTM